MLQQQFVLIVLQGKEPITTYWLQNADNFHLPLPDLSKAANESEHTFK